MISGGGDDRRPLAGAATTYLLPTARGGGDVVSVNTFTHFVFACPGDKNQKSLFFLNDLGQNSFVSMIWDKIVLS